VAQPHIDVDPWPAEVDVAVRTGDGAQAAVTSGAGFSLSPEEARAVLSEAQTALDKLQRLQRQAEIFKRVNPAAGDPASVAYNARLADGQGVFSVARDRVGAEAAYLEELIKKLHDAFRMIGGHETAAARDIGRAGEPKGGVAG
jgi:hypothetical protein